MIPGFELFGLTIRTYSLMAAVAAVTFTAMSVRPLRRCGLSAAAIAVMLLSICVAFPVGARLLYAAVCPDSFYEGRPWYELRMGGFSMYGGIAGTSAVILFAALFTRVRHVKLLDAVTIPGAVSFSVARVGCFLNGCCSGKETDLPWGVVFPSETDGVSAALTNAHAVHPTQLYELILALLGIPICLLIVKKARAGEGGLFFIYGAWFCTMRLLVHPFRSLPYGQIVTVVIFPLLYYTLTVAGVFLFVWSCRKGREKAV